LSYDKFIYGQGLGDAAKTKMGVGIGKDNGCGWVATYNALSLMNNAHHPSNIIAWLEQYGGSNFLGVAGANPDAINLYLGVCGYSTSLFYTPSNIDATISASKRGIGILAYFFPDLNAHYVMIEHKDGQYHIYNYRNSATDKRIVDSVDAWLRDNEDGASISLITIN